MCKLKKKNLANLHLFLKTLHINDKGIMAQNTYVPHFMPMCKILHTKQFNFKSSTNQPSYIVVKPRNSGMIFTLFTSNWCVNRYDKACRCLHADSDMK